MKYISPEFELVIVPDVPILCFSLQFGGDGMPGSDLGGGDEYEI